MKKINKVKLNDYHEMSDYEMKNILGGSGCRATCGGGIYAEITDCPGTCSATDGVGATCITQTSYIDENGYVVSGIVTTTSSCPESDSSGSI